MDNGGTSDGDDHRDDRSVSHNSEQDGSHSANGHSPRPAGRSRSRFYLTKQKITF